MPPAQSPQPATQRLRLSSAERQREIVDALVSLAGERGPEAVTTQAIAARVGLTHGALFRHFPDKQAMWSAVLDWVQAQLEALLDAALRGRGKPLDRLERLFLAHVAFVTGRPGVPRIVLHELQRPSDTEFHVRARTMVGAYRARIVELLALAKRAGELPAALDEEAAAVLFIGTVQGLAVQSSLFRAGADMEAVARRIFPLLLDGFRGVRR